METIVVDPGLGAHYISASTVFSDSGDESTLTLVVEVAAMADEPVIVVPSAKRRKRDTLDVCLFLSHLPHKRV